MAAADPIQTTQPTHVSERRFSLLHLFLLATLVGVVISLWDARRESQRIQAALPTLRSMARQLTVVDSTKMAAVMRHPTWYDEMIWDVYLPPSHRYQLCFAKGPMDGRQNEPLEATTTISIASGRHTLEAISTHDPKVRSLAVIIDGQRHLLDQSDLEPPGDRVSQGTSGGSRIGDNTSQPPDKPLHLFHRTYQRYASGSLRSDEVWPGYALWIEAIDPPAAK